MSFNNQNFGGLEQPKSIEGQLNPQSLMKNKWVVGGIALLVILVLTWLWWSYYRGWGSD
jgi:cell division septal protein FtsQ